MAGISQGPGHHGDPCPVCERGVPARFCSLGERRYLRCPVCEATLLHPACRLPPEDERAVYELHDNQPDDPGYRSFLARLTEPLTARLPVGAHGLDFGCGPGPALARMMEEAGMAMCLYDPFFYPSESALSASYDFVTCTEVIEHLYHPASVFRQLSALLKPGGWLGVMTCFQTDDARFEHWHYRRDPTHVVFYREATLAHIANRLGWSLEVPRKDVALFRKGG